MRGWSVWRVLLICLMGQMTSASSQEPSESEVHQNQITFPAIVATADLDLLLPIHLSLSPQVQIGSLTMDMTFPSPPLAFVRVELVYQAESVGAQVVVEEIEPGKVHLTIAVPEDGKEPLSGEGIASLVFRAAEETEPTPFNVVMENIEMKALNGQPVEILQEAEAVIHIVSPELYPLISCFFFMH